MQCTVCQQCCKFHVTTRFGLVSVPLSVDLAPNMDIHLLDCQLTWAYPNKAMHRTR